MVKPLLGIEKIEFCGICEKVLFQKQKKKHWEVFVVNGVVVLVIWNAKTLKTQKKTSDFVATALFQWIKE